ncbi:hypothetical protein PF011_g29949 [Phytophthora fragariae]|uniref:Uncharacterized protein n=1 Tax=Phytophthora fragariae TaxID=53985 RepID=A0A6A3GV35_9STRA|nr:hypothetical protein PF011_g29949 [Phytophthora fragariae]
MSGATFFIESKESYFAFNDRLKFRWVSIDEAESRLDLGEV